MKGLTVISAIYQNDITDNYQQLFEMIKEKYGFDIWYTDRPEIPSDIDVLIVDRQRTYNNAMMNLEHLNKKVKMIGILGDIHSLDLYYNNGLKMMARYDVILSGAKEVFLERYPQFAYKFIWFPEFFAPHDRYAKLSFNEQPLPKCLLAGSIWPENLYPIRSYVAKNGNPSTTDLLPYPGYHPDSEAINSVYFCVRSKYANTLNAYLCCLTSTHCSDGCSKDKMLGEGHYSGFEAVLLKNIEIPAAGSLLLTEQCKDLDDMGFVPHEHYIPVNKENVLEWIDKAIGEKFTDVRKAGMEMVRANHSVNNRFKQLEEML